MKDKKEKPEPELSVKIFWGIVLFLLFTFILFVICVLIYANWYQDSESGTKYRMKDIWEFSLPDDAEMIYQERIDLRHYSVFALTEEPTELLSEFSKDDSEEFETNFITWNFI